MARESQASARNPRRVSTTPDASRSSMRRIASRRNTRPPPRESVNSPRNRRLARATPVPKGPGLIERGSGALVSGVRAASASLLQLAGSARSSLATRVFGPATTFLRVLGVLACLAGAVALGRFVQQHLTTSAAFAIDRIDMQGLARLERKELLDAAGLALGANIFSRKPEDVRARLLRHPWILSAEVERRLPSRFTITIHEREPVALLAVEACARTHDDESCEEPSSLYLVSDEAKLFKRLSGKDPVDLPVITGVTRQRFASDPELSRRVLVDAVALLHDYRNSGLISRATIGELHIEANDGLSLYVGEDLTYVRLGAPPYADKLLRMKRVFERLEREQAHAEYIYLDNVLRPDRVAVRLR